MSEAQPPPQEIDAIPDAMAEKGEEPKKSPHALFISGGYGTYAGIRGIAESLDDSYDGNMTHFNSILSPDPQNPHRFDQIADDIKKHIGEGIHIITHSLGTGEASVPLKRLRKKGFFDNPSNAENTHITLIAPASLKGLRAPFRFLRNTVKFVREQAESPISKKRTVLRGIDSLTAFPPTDMDDAVLTEGLRAALRDQSQYAEGVAVIPFEGDASYTEKLSAKKREEVAAFDERLKAAMGSNNYEAVRELVRDRGELLRDPLNKVYAGDFEDTPEPILEATKATMGGYIGLLRVITGSMFNTPLREMRRLERKGVKVDFVIPENDIWKPRVEAEAFYDTPAQASKNVHIHERGAHAYPALLGRRFGESMRKLDDEVRAA